MKKKIGRIGSNPGAEEFRERSMTHRGVPAIGRIAARIGRETSPELTQLLIELAKIEEEKAQEKRQGGNGESVDGILKDYLDDDPNGQLVIESSKEKGGRVKGDTLVMQTMDDGNGSGENEFARDQLTSGARAILEKCEQIEGVEGAIEISEYGRRQITDIIADLKMLRDDVGRAMVLASLPEGVRKQILLWCKEEVEQKKKGVATPKRPKLAGIQVLAVEKGRVRTGFLRPEQAKELKKDREAALNEFFGG